MQECSTCLKFQFVETAVSWQDVGNAGYTLNFHCQAATLQEKDPQTEDLQLFQPRDWKQQSPPNIPE